MIFDNYKVFIYILIFILVYNGFKLLVKRTILRSAFVMAFNIVVLLTLINEHTVIVLTLLSILIFLFGRLLQKWHSGIFLGVLLFLVILIFSIRNYPIILESISTGTLSFIYGPLISVQKIGLSYILFRFIHWLIESYRKNISKSDVFTFINYILFFPSILAGPIDTYKNFHYWTGNKRVKYSVSLFYAGVTRIIFGAFKTLIIVPVIINYATDYSILTNEYYSIPALFLSLLAYSAYIYLDFSGYSDIAIGTAYLVGFKTPENFNNPYFSVNLSEFWKRWHITFSTFLKYYIFKPFIHVFNSIINPKYRLLVTILAYVTTFIICGLWHGETVNFVVWGLWHGVGLSINKLWVSKVIKGKSFLDKKWYVFSSVCLTFIYVTIGWMFFHYSMDQITDIFNLI